MRERLARLDAAVSRIPVSHRPTASRVLDLSNAEIIVAGPASFQHDVIGRAGGRKVTGEMAASTAP